MARKGTEPLGQPWGSTGMEPGGAATATGDSHGGVAALPELTWSWQSRYCRGSPGHGCSSLLLRSQ